MATMLAGTALAVPTSGMRAMQAVQQALMPVRPRTSHNGSLLEDVLSLAAPIHLGYQRPAGELALLRADYERDRADCTWEASTAFYVHDMNTGKEPRGQLLSAFDANQTIPMYKCRTIAEVSNDSRWHIFRIGAMSSSGGYDWHSIVNDDDPLAMLPSLKAHGRLWITAFDMSTLDAKMSLLPLPPIHIHHSHLGARWNSTKTGQFYSEHGLSIGFSHADTACRPDAGGPMCQMRTFPAGYGMRYEEAMGFDGLLNDVRDKGSSPLTFYFEVAISFTTTPVQRPIGLIYCNTAVVPVLQETHPDDQWFGTFEVPAAQESIVWSVNRYDYSGKLLNLWLHTHTAFGYDGMWLVNGAPSDLGLALADWQHFEYPFRPNEHGLTTGDFKEHVLRSMRANGLTFRCILNPHNVHLDDDNPRLMRPGIYGFMSDVSCYEGADVVRAGEPITTIAFFSPRMNNPIPASGKPVTAGMLYQQHIHYQSFAVFDETHPAWPSTDFYESYRNESMNSKFPFKV